MPSAVPHDRALSRDRVGQLFYARGRLTQPGRSRGVEAGMRIEFPRAHSRAIPWLREDVAALLLRLVVLITALLPRIIQLGMFVTVDEADHWIERSTTFLAALRSGDLAATAITSHPGVITMWLGSAGIVLHELALQAHLAQDTFAARLALMQLPVALANALGVMVGYALLRRLLPAHTAFLAALLWAADPFLIAYSRVLHVDALTSTFVTLSFLAACVYWNHTPQRRTLVLSGVFAGMGLLCKSPALVLFPAVGLLALSARTPRRAVGALAVWGLAAAATAALLWPALLVEPMRVVELVASGVTDNGAVPHANGNFFLGQATDAPGLLFYPVVLAMRTTPITLVGLLLLPWAWRDLAHHRRRDMAALALLVLLVLLALSIFAKKHNRYLVPAFPAVDVLAAVGLAGALARISLRRVRQAAAAALVAAAALNLAFWHPYSIASFNQLLGGAQAGADDFLVGWGEGLEQVAAWLNEQPDSQGAWVATTLKSPLAAYLRPGMHVMQPNLDMPEKIRYVVVYVRNAQGGPPAPPFDRYYQYGTPAHTVSIHGVPYAWIYQVQPQITTASGASFGDALALRGFSLDVGDAGAVALKLAWQTTRAGQSDYAAFVHVLGPDGQRYAQLDPQLATGGLGVGRFLTSELPFSLPADAPAGTYRVLLGTYDPATGQRLALGGAQAADPALDGGETLLLTTFTKSGG
ncbi:glycosyltransferase family 39 protein [Chloroflexia bacterium SDU3-3]|nr:glycosyltransferase family 39 protein [Chloroflexia bacterium SDU3-3]